MKNMVTNIEFAEMQQMFNDLHGVDNMVHGIKFWQDNCLQLTAKWFVDTYNRNLSQMHYRLPDHGKKINDYLDVYTNQSWSPIIKFAKDYDERLRHANTFKLTDDSEMLTESIKATGMRQYPYLGIYIAQCMLNDKVIDESLTLEDMKAEWSERYTPSGRKYYSKK